MAKYKKLNLKTVQEWLEVRKSRIGGSEIASVLGINPWESKYELYLRKKGETEPKEETMIMRLGHKQERCVAELLEEEAGYQIIKNTSGNLIYLSEEYPFAEASPDRLAYLPGCKKTKDNLCLVEIKTTQKTIDPEDIPAHWVCQVQWYMGIIGLKTCVLAWLTRGMDFGYVNIDFDEDFFMMMIEEATKFAEDLKNEVVPDAVTAADVALRYPKQNDGQNVEVSSEVAEACEKFKALGAQIKALEAEKDACSELIKVAIKDAETISYSGLILASYKASKESTKFDAKTFQAENPELAAKYMYVSAGARRLNVK